MRKYQIDAIKAIQDAVADDRDRFLFEMATGTGKTDLIKRLMTLLHLNDQFCNISMNGLIMKTITGLPMIGTA